MYVKLSRTYERFTCRFSHDSRRDATSDWLPMQTFCRLVFALAFSLYFGLTRETGGRTWLPLVHKCGKNIELATQEAPRGSPLKGRSGVRDAGMEIVSGGRLCRGSGSYHRVDLEGQRGTRFQQTKAATLPAGYLLATLDSYRLCVREKGGGSFAPRLTHFLPRFIHICLVWKIIFKCNLTATLESRINIHSVDPKWTEEKQDEALKMLCV